CSPSGRVCVLGIPGQRRLAQDHQSVDTDAQFQGLIARLSYVPAGVVRAITGNVYGSPLRTEWGTCKLRHSGVNAPADRGTIGKRPWRFEEPIPERLGRLRPVYQHPVDDDLLFAESLSLNRQNAKATTPTRLNCLKHAGIGERRGITLPLQ